MKINEIFYSLQGEGYWTGTPAVFVRLSGCNLRCSFFDTSHENGTQRKEEDIVAEVAKYPAHHVVITGGEPSLFLTHSLVEALHQAGKFVAVETNGTHPLPDNVDWVTLSPKDRFESNATPVLTRCNELKVVCDGTPPPTYPDIEADHHFVQPCDVGDAQENQRIMAATVAFCLEHPTWRLSLQTHKIAGIQ